MAKLILTRRVGETIRIRGDIEVTVTCIRNGQVRIAIEAPKDVSVDREEIAVRKDRERRLGQAAPAMLP